MAFWKSEIFFILGLDTISEYQNVTCPSDHFAATQGSLQAIARGRAAIEVVGRFAGTENKIWLRCRCTKRQITLPVADSGKGRRGVTAIEFRRKKMCELEALLERLNSLQQSTLRPDLKDRFTRTCLRQIDRITAILDNPALARLCSD